MSDYQLPPEDTEPQRRPEMPGRRSALDRLKGRVDRRDEGRDDATRLHEDFVREPGEARSGRWDMPWWSLAVVILIVAVITCGLWGIVLMSRGDAATTTGPTPTPIFVVITATPTLGPAVEETPDEAAAEEETPEEVEIPGVIPTLTPVPITVGSGVIIDGTEGDGLSIRQGPGLSFTTFFVGNDGDTFLVQDGPREADGYIWWYLVDPNDANRSGWSVDIFLEVLGPS